VPNGGVYVVDPDQTLRIEWHQMLSILMLIFRKHCSLPVHYYIYISIKVWNRSSTLLYDKIVCTFINHRVADGVTKCC